MPDIFITFVPSFSDQALDSYSAFIRDSNKPHDFAERLDADLQTRAGLDNCDVMAMLLQLRGYEVTTARTMAEAMNLAKQHYFDLYLPGRKLSDGDGLDLCNQIRTLTQNSRQRHTGALSLVI